MQITKEKMMRVGKKSPARQGDLSFHVVKEIPSRYKETPHNGNYHLRDSSISGNIHRVDGKPESFKVYTAENSDHIVAYLEIFEDVVMNHCDSSGNQREHKPFILEPSIKKVMLEIEINPIGDMIREVQD